MSRLEQVAWFLALATVGLTSSELRASLMSISDNPGVSNLVSHSRGMPGGSAVNFFGLLQRLHPALLGKLAFFDRRRPYA